MSLDAELLDGFTSESKQILEELQELVDELENHQEFPTDKIQEFSQKIDRIMGAAKTLLTIDNKNTGIRFLAKTGELCKAMGYEAAALPRPELVPFFASFWAETVEVMQEVLYNIKDPRKCQSIVVSKSSSIEKRLIWLASKVAPTSEEERNRVLALLKKI